MHACASVPTGVCLCMSVCAHVTVYEHSICLFFLDIQLSVLTVFFFLLAAEGSNEKQWKSNLWFYFLFFLKHTNHPQCLIKSSQWTEMDLFWFCRYFLILKNTLKESGASCHFSPFKYFCGKVYLTIWNPKCWPFVTTCPKSRILTFI